MIKILIIDDDQSVCKLLENLITHLGYNAVSKHNLKDGFAELAIYSYDVVFLDIRLPDGNGLEAIPEIKKRQPSPEIIVITAFGESDGAEIAIKNGAWDYLQKPLSPKSMMLPIKRILQYRNDLLLANKKVLSLNNDEIIGSSSQMKDCLTNLYQATKNDSNVLIFGETGTGKELFARAIHKNSSRSRRNFVVVDCSTLPVTLVESILFGYEKGSYSGAEKSQIGLILQADKGTLFLDEISELNYSIQKTLLRVLEDHRFRPIGCQSEVMSDFRLIAATNKNLDDMVKNNQFQDALLYRLKTIYIELPPLRKHLEDLPELVKFHLNKITSKQNLKIKNLSPDFLNSLYLYEWSGNIRELVNVLEWSIISAQDSTTIEKHHLPVNFRAHLAKTSINHVHGNAIEVDEVKKDVFPNFKKHRQNVLSDQEKNYLLELMELTHGNINKACQLSNLSRARLYNLMKKYNISRMGWQKYSKSE
jgi:two-component system, NtrC family, response regulator